MKTKLVSLNAGIRMTVRRGKKEQTTSFTCVLPSKEFYDPHKVIMAICDFLNDEFGTQYYAGRLSTSPVVPVLKPKRISRPVVDTEKIIRELVT